MARLVGRDMYGDKWFRLTPIVRTDGMDASHYAVEFGYEGEKAVVSHTFSVEDWQSEHKPIWDLARTFTEVGSFVDTRISVGLEHNDWAPGAVYNEAGWLQTIIWGHSDLVAARFYVREGGDPDVFRQCFLQSEIEAAHCFGASLEQEIIGASPEWWDWYGSL